MFGSCINSKASPHWSACWMLLFFWSLLDQKLECHVISVLHHLLAEPVKLKVLTYYPSTNFCNSTKYKRCFAAYKDCFKLRFYHVQIKRNLHTNSHNYTLRKTDLMFTLFSDYLLNVNLINDCVFVHTYYKIIQCLFFNVRENLK